MYEPIENNEAQETKMTRNIIYTNCQFPAPKPIQTMGNNLIIKQHN